MNQKKNKINIGINGCGRIAKCLIRMLDKHDNLNLVSINHYNTCVKINDVLKYIKYDTIHGRYILKNKSFYIHHYKNPSEIPWEKEIDIIIDTTGKFKTKQKLESHIKYPHQKVLLSCPSEEIFMYIYGINHYLIALEKPNIFSGASCTTNASSPILKILDDNWEIVNCFLTTIHSNTSSNNIVDRINLESNRKGFSGNYNIIPSSTGASKAISKINPKLLGKVNAVSYRVPTINVSIIELCVNLNKKTTISKILNKFRELSDNNYKDIIEVNDENLVSSCFIGNSNSSIIDSHHCQELGNKFFKIVIWYDNEWGYSNNLINLIKFTMNN